MKKVIAVLLAVMLLTAGVSATGETAGILRLDIKDKPEKFEYLTGEALDLDGLYITVTYEDGKTEDVAVTADMVSGYDANTPGAQVITVIYRGRSTSFSVKVVKEYSTVNGEVETIEFDTSPETHSESEKEGEPSKVIIMIAVTAAAAAAGVCIAAMIKKPKKEDEK